MGDTWNHVYAELAFMSSDSRDNEFFPDIQVKVCQIICLTTTFHKCLNFPNTILAFSVKVDIMDN